MYFTWAAAISSVIFNSLHVISFQEWHSTQCPQTAETNEWDELFRETLCKEAAWFYVMTIAHLMGAGVLIVGAAKTSFSLLHYGLSCYFLNVCLGLLAFRLDFIEKSSLLTFVGAVLLLGVCSLPEIVNLRNKEKTPKYPKLTEYQSISIPSPDNWLPD